MGRRALEELSTCSSPSERGRETSATKTSTGPSRQTRSLPSEWPQRRGHGTCMQMTKKLQCESKAIIYVSLVLLLVLFSCSVRTYYLNTLPLACMTCRIYSARICLHACIRLYQWVLHARMCDIYLKCVIGLYGGNYEVALLYNESPIHVLLYILTQDVDQRTFICNQPGEVLIV